MIQIRSFGKIGEQDIPLITLSDGAAEVELFPYGAAIRSVRVPDRNGVMTDVCLGYDTPEEYAPWGFDLTFCGHGHGGIFRIPILDKGLLGSDRSLFPDYDGGLFTIGESSFVVSRGLGSNTVPFHAFRLFNRPHIPLAILTRGKSGPPV